LIGEKGSVRKLVEMALRPAYLSVVQVPTWDRYDWLRHGFSTRQGGTSEIYGGQTLNLGFTKDDEPERVRENRRLFAGAVAGGAPMALVAVSQVHGTTVQTIFGTDSLQTPEGRAIFQADGLMTAAPGILLAIQAADCVPVLLADVRQRVVAGFHAGWRGTVSRIVEQGVAQMIADFGSRPEDLTGAVGPAIGACCYTVGEEVRNAFESVFPYAEALFRGSYSNPNLDLAEANRRQLLQAGLAAEAIFVLGECTACARLPDGSRKYFSHRAEHGFTGRAMGIIGVRN